MNSKKTRDASLEDVYAKLGQALDGLWFLKIEEEFGFDKALEIDDKVWKIYGKIEARRLRRFYENLGLLKGKSSLEILDIIAGKSLFNKTLSYKTRVVDGNSLDFIVNGCKTYEGMCKIGRDDQQVHRVCYDIGIAFFEAFAKEIDPSFTVKCLFTPKTRSEHQDEQGILCGWQFSLQG